MTNSESSLAETLPAGLPAEAKLQQVVFTTSAAENHEHVLFKLPAAIQSQAIVKQTVTGLSPGQHQVALLTVPTEVTSDDNASDDADLLMRIREWLKPSASAVETATTNPVQMMTLQGVRLFWTHDRIAVVAQPDRIQTVSLALLEAWYFAAELTSVEQELAQLWPTLEADTPSAYEADSNTLLDREQLGKRFQQVFRLNARIARISPHVHCPHVYPPTLASQVGERLRERTRMEYRHEIICDQIEVFRGVYEMCSQRVNDYAHTRSGLMLEWIIIILLVVQVFLYGFEILTYESVSPTADAQPAATAPANAGN